MKVNILNRWLMAAAISVVPLLGMSISANAEQEPQKEQHQDKNQQKQHAKQQPQHQDKNRPQQHAQQQHSAPVQQHPEHTQHAQLQRSQQQQHAQEVEQHNTWQQHRARNWESEHHTWQQRGGYNGYRIPDDYYRVHYGRGHWFRVYSLPFMVVGGHPRFQYGGYWFSFVDPYPEYWGSTWYQNDDVYVSYYNDGYYLYNRRHPDRPGVAISISF